MDTDQNFHGENTLFLKTEGGNNSESPRSVNSFDDHPQNGNLVEKLKGEKNEEEKLEEENIVEPTQDIPLQQEEKKESSQEVEIDTGQKPQEDNNANVEVKEEIKEIKKKKRHH